MNELEDIGVHIHTILNHEGFDYTESKIGDTGVELNLRSGIMFYFLFRYNFEHDLLYVFDGINYADCSIFNFSTLTDEAWHFQQMTVNKLVTFTCEEAQQLMEVFNTVYSTKEDE